MSSSLSLFTHGFHAPFSIRCILCCDCGLWPSCRIGSHLLMGTSVYCIQGTYVVVIAYLYVFDMYVIFVFFLYYFVYCFLFFKIYMIAILWWIYIGRKCKNCPSTCALQIQSCPNPKMQCYSFKRIFFFQF